MSGHESSLNSHLWLVITALCAPPCWQDIHSQYT